MSALAQPLLPTRPGIGYRDVKTRCHRYRFVILSAALLVAGGLLSELSRWVVATGMDGEGVDCASAPQVCCDWWGGWWKRTAFPPC